MNSPATNAGTVAISSNTSWYLFNFRSNLIRALSEKGLRVWCLAPRDDYSDRLRALGCEFTHIPIDGSGKNPVTDLGTCLAYWRAYRRIRPRVALHYTPKPNIYGGLAARATGTAFINNIAGLGEAFSDRGLINRIARTLYRLSQRHAARLFFQNPQDHAQLQALDTTVTARAAILPGSGVDTERFAPAPFPQEGSIRFVLIARLLWEKGVREYVEAARLLKQRHANVDCVVVGFSEPDNPRFVPAETMQAWNAEGLIHWLGRMDDVRPIIANAHCVVLPSYYGEGVPRSLLEGASMGRPIITTDSVGCREVVEDGKNGYRVPPRDVMALCQAMERIVSASAEEREQMGKRSRAKVIEGFNEQIVIDKYLNAIDAVLER
jgi:glycosyltransferase involved in cell wall biosynthesis